MYIEELIRDYDIDNGFKYAVSNMLKNLKSNDVIAAMGMA